MRIIDLSAPIVPSPTDAAPFERVAIHYTPHVEGAAQIQATLCVPPHLLRNGEGWAVEEFTKLGTHSVTHVDAPWHYNSQIQSRRAATIDELPLEWFFADGVVLDMTHKADGEKVEVGDVRPPWQASAIRSSRLTSYWQGRVGMPSTASRTTRGAAVRLRPGRPAGITGGSAGPTRAVAILPD